MKIEKTEKLRNFLELCLNQVECLEKVTIEANENFNEDPLLFQMLSEVWPAAVEPALLTSPGSQADKLLRAQNIIAVLLPSVTNKKFLDFGCGEGHVVKTVAEKDASCSIGFDITNQAWDQLGEGNFKVTLDWEEVKSHAPYDIILIYDVLDHIVNADWADELRKVRNVLSPHGSIYLRCHPWCSRHGTHLYHQINRAYPHFFFTDDELKAKGYTPMPTRKIIHPLDTYKSLFKEVGLKMSAEPFVIRDVVEPFFTHANLRSMITSHYKDSPYPNLSSGNELPMFQMEQSFLDFCLQV